MINLKNCSKVFIDFDGVIVDSNNFKEIAIEKSILKLFSNQDRSIEAINYFNENAGLSRIKKLSLFFKQEEVSRLMKIYSDECNQFFQEALPNAYLKQFLEYLSHNHNKISIFILSGGEKKEIEFFLKKNRLISHFEEILASSKSKIEHLKDKKVSNNDIFIGDSKNDLKASLSSGIKFILFEEYKSNKSFPSEDLIKGNVFLRTKNFQTLMQNIIL